MDNMQSLREQYKMLIIKSSKGIIFELFLLNKEDEAISLDFDLDIRDLITLGRTEISIYDYDKKTKELKNKKEIEQKVLIRGDRDIIEFYLDRKLLITYRIENGKLGEVIRV